MDDLLKFLQLTHQFQAIKRKVLLEKGVRAESDVEHSYQLGMAAWYLINKEKLPLDINLALKYALTHDLVEVYAGDTPAGLFTGYESEQATKIKREEEAAERLKKEFPEFPELHELIHKYEERADEECKFVYALDKLLPILNVYLDDGYSWKTHKITFDRLKDDKTGKIALSPDVKKYFDLIIERLSADEGKYFG